MKRTAIITGASSGMGKEFAVQLDKSGKYEQIVGIARNIQQLDEVKAQLKTPFIPVSCDLSNETDVDAFTKGLAEKDYDIAMLINCAGFGKFGNYRTIPEGAEVSMVKVDALAVVEMSRACLPYMKAGGIIINLASVAAFQPLPDMNVYAASKAFVLSYSRALDVEAHPAGLSVTAVCPGWVKTPFLTTAKKGADEAAVKNFAFASTPEFIVKKALAAAYKRKQVCVPTGAGKVQQFFAKVLPASWVMAIWNKIRQKSL